MITFLALLTAQLTPMVEADPEIPCLTGSDEKISFEGLDAIQKALSKVRAKGKAPKIPASCKEQPDAFLNGYNTGADRAAAPASVLPQYLSCFEISVGMDRPKTLSDLEPARKVPKLPPSSDCFSRGHAEFARQVLEAIDGGVETARNTCEAFRKYGAEIAKDAALPEGTKGKGAICPRARTFFEVLVDQQITNESRIKNARVRPTNDEAHQNIYTIRDLNVNEREVRRPFIDKLFAARPAIAICVDEGYQEEFENRAIDLARGAVDRSSANEKPPRAETQDNGKIHEVAPADR